MHINPIVNNSGDIVKAGCIIMNDDHEILLVLNNKENIWGLPKGHAEENEAPQETAIREVLEETGLSVVIEKPLEDLKYTDKHGHEIRVHYFLAKPEQRLENGELEQRWFTYDDAVSIVLPHVRQYLTVVRDML